MNSVSLLPEPSVAKVSPSSACSTAAAEPCSDSKLPVPVPVTPSVSATVRVPKLTCTVTVSSSLSASLSEKSPNAAPLWFRVTVIAPGGVKAGASFTADTLIVAVRVVEPDPPLALPSPSVSTMVSGRGAVEGVFEVFE
jgi:hypothetical protein